jgi:CheY-like chemotaxis protein
MTTLSAASLNGLLTVHPIAFPQPCAADQVPRGRILVFEDQTVIALDLQRILREAGFRVAGPAGRLEEVQRLMHGRLDGAVIDLDSPPQTAAAVTDLLAEAGIPVVLLATSRESVPENLARRKLIEKPYAPSQLLEALIAAIDEPAAAADEGILYPVTPPAPFPRVLPQL